MITRAAAALILLLSTTADTSAKQLSGRELANFLGSVSPGLCVWEKDIGPGIELYHGTANAPISGRINITLTLAGWSSGIPIDVPSELGQLGIFPVYWQKWANDEYFFRTATFADDHEQRVDVFVYAKNEVDANRLANEASRLPMFNSTMSTPFRAMIVRKQIARVVDWLLLPSLFVLSVWLPDRYLRKRNARPERRALTLLAISAAWIPLLYFGLIFSWRFSAFSPVLAILRAELGHSWWLLSTMVFACLIAALFTVLWSLLRRIIRSRFATDG
jgi:hypothetical protein